MAYESTIKPAPLSANTPVYWLGAQPVTGHQVAPGFPRTQAPAPGAEDLDMDPLAGILYQPIWPIPGASGVHISFAGEGRRYTYNSLGELTSIRHWTISGEHTVPATVYRKVTPEQARKILCQELVASGGFYPTLAVDAAKITLLLGVPWIKVALSCTCNWTLVTDTVDPATATIVSTATTTGTKTLTLRDYYWTQFLSSTLVDLAEALLSPTTFAPTLGLNSFDGLVYQLGSANTSIPGNALVTPVGGSSHWYVAPAVYTDRGLEATLSDDYTLSLLVV
jgi:hypothetical protein